MKINKPVSIIIIFVIALLFIFLFVMPKYQSFNNVQNTLVQKQTEYDGKYIYYAKIAELIKNINSKKDALEKIDSALPSDFYLSSLVYFVQRKGAEMGMSVKSMTLLQIAPEANAKNNIKNITFSLHLSGTYESFKKFLSSLDKSARLIDINSISFTAPATLQNSKQSKNLAPVYDFSMEIQAHTY